MNPAPVQMLLTNQINFISWGVVMQLTIAMALAPILTSAILYLKDVIVREIQRPKA